MIVFEQECWATMISDDRSSWVLAYFTKEEDALAAGKGKSWYGSDGTAVHKNITTIVYENLDEFDYGLMEKQRKEALSKLTPYEKKILGL